MNVIVAIHNAVNEKAWHELAKVERRLHPECECGPKLVSIRGLSSKLSPKVSVAPSPQTKVGNALLIIKGK